jgi:hypothetical protein
LVDGTCVDNTGNCQSTAEGGICSECKANYSLVGYECISKDVRVFGCNLHLKNGSCVSCKLGFHLSEGECLLKR